MTKNMGSLDRTVRIILAIALLAYAIFGSATGITAILAGVIGVVFLLTSFVSFCPLYRIVGLKTCQDC